ncbi:NAD(P)H-dependent oxidoreductase [Chelativorans sp. YIM 93263]|uniref:NAD(P)H-dependent oxidoreductase n=1 Tax=Chelativorans sp. YIM 93263 TaxID=2906648 RepID=UPI002378091E|nr:NAD(P)H-dependent oxidoreductase [Chelativorans sp. YIM 93263]
MHVLIVYTHPEPNSFNGAMKTAAAKHLRTLGHTVEISDLYAEGFDPAEKAAHYIDRVNPALFTPLAEQRHAGRNGTLPDDVQREIDRIERADLVLFQFPLWWHAQPAILKGWFDRVFVSGKLYTSSMRYDRGIFRGKRAVLSVTTGAPEAAFGPGGRGGDIELLLWPIQYSLHYVGFSVLEPFLSFSVAGHGYSYEDDREKIERLEGYQDAWIARLSGIQDETPLAFPGWADWDDAGRLKPERTPETALRFRKHKPAAIDALNC